MLTKLPLQLFSLSKYLTMAQRHRSSGGRVCVLGDESWERGGAEVKAQRSVPEPRKAERRPAHRGLP